MSEELTDAEREAFEQECRELGLPDEETQREVDRIAAEIDREAPAFPYFEVRIYASGLVTRHRFDCWVLDEVVKNLAAQAATVGSTIIEHLGGQCDVIHQERPSGRDARVTRVRWTEGE